MKAISISLICLFLTGLSYSSNMKYQEKAPVRIYLEHHKYPDKHQLKVIVLSRVERRYLPAQGVEVKLFKSEIAPDNLVGSTITGIDGTAIYTLSQEQFDWATNQKELEYFAVVNEDSALKGAEKKLSIRDVKLNVSFYMKDSVKFVQANVFEIDSTGSIIPQKRVKVQFMVQRPLSPLIIGDNSNSTDANGIASTVFPDDLPGDKDGHVNIIVKIVDNDDYGFVENSMIKEWGLPTHVDDKTLMRSLWASSANAPIPLLIFINALILGVWGMIVFIIYKVIIIYKIGKKHIVNN